jgi:hypothetical protein
MIIPYVGPGLGGGVLAVVSGIIVSFFLMLFAIIWYPFKRLINRFRKKEEHGGFHTSRSES